MGGDDINRNIMSFIDKINEFDRDNVLVETFTRGFCYDFAYMLQRIAPGSLIVWVANRRHYVLEYQDVFYDITGVVTISDDDQIVYGEGEGDELSIP